MPAACPDWASRSVVYCPWRLEHIVKHLIDMSFAECASNLLLIDAVPFTAASGLLAVACGTHGATPYR